VRLSICIATLNRGAFIGETLKSIGAQMRDDVEIVVLDGASKDDTEQVVRALQHEIPRLRYIKQNANHGVDRDFNTVVEHATGDYCWLMSDDDLVMPGAVEVVLETIETSYSLVILNSEIKTLDFSRMLDRDRLRFLGNRVYRPHDFERLFEETSAYLTYIGAVVIKRNIWLERDRQSYFGSYFIHVGVIFQAPLPADALVIAKPCISIRFGNTQWRPKEFEIRMIRWTELVWSLPSLSDEVKTRCYRREPWRSVKSLVFYRAKGTYSMTEYRRWVKPQLMSSWDTARALGVALLPGVLANLIGLVFCSFPYRDSNIHLLDMKASRFYLPNLFRKRRLPSTASVVDA
jgi:glycosyltransferase involved in cell wall biosynthesis